MNKDDTIALIRSLLNSTASALSVSDLNREFKRETGVEIPLFGYRNVSDFLHSIPQSVKLTGDYPSEQVSLIVSDKSAHIKLLVQHQKFGKKENVISQKSNVNYRSKKEHEKASQKRNFNGFKNPNSKDQSPLQDRLAYLKSSFCHCERVPLIDLEGQTSVGEYTEVCPCDIVSPSKFCFQLRKFKRKLWGLMNDMQMFYADHREGAFLPSNLMKAEQVCAVLYKRDAQEKWYRAEIQEVVSGSHAVVNFIDFGGSAEVLKDSIKFLHKSFVSLPRQAFSGSLANIRPKFRLKWSPSAVKRFHELAFEKDLVAGVVNIDAEDYHMTVALSSTSGEEIHINDALVKEGYAEFEEAALGNQLLDSLDEDKALSEAKMLQDRGGLSLRQSCWTERPSQEALSAQLGGCTSSKTQVPVNALQICSSNHRLKRMFSASEELQ